MSTMSAADNCIICENEFSLQHHGFKRRKSTSIGSPYTWRKTFPAKQRTGFVCGDCFQNKFAAVTARQRNTARRRWTGARTPKKRLLEPVSTPPRVKRLDLRATPKKVPRALNTEWEEDIVPIAASTPTGCNDSTSTQSDLERVGRMIQQSQYKDAFKLLVRTSSTAFQHMLAIVTGRMVEELRAASRKKNRRTIHSLAGAVSMERLREFSWTDTLAEVQQKMPTLHTVLSATLPPAEKIMLSKQSRIMSSVQEKLAQDLRQCRLGAISSVILYTHKPLLYKLVPQMMGVECWREGASEHLVSLLHDIGLSSCTETARSRVDAIALSYDHDLKVWKKNVQTCKEYQRSLTETNSSSVKACKSGSHSSASTSASALPARTSASLASASTSASHPPASTSASHPPASTSASHPPASTSASHPPASTSASHPPASTSASHPPASTSASHPPARTSASLASASTSASLASASTSASHPPASTSALPPSARTSASHPPASTSALPPSASTSASLPPASTSASLPSGSMSSSRPPARTSASLASASTSASHPPASTSALPPSASTSASHPPASTSASLPSGSMSSSRPPASTSALPPPARTLASPPSASTSASQSILQASMSASTVTRAQLREVQSVLPRFSKSAGWDNVQIEKHKKHQSGTNRNQMYMWAMCFFLDHRTPSLEMDDVTRKSASCLSPYTWLPDNSTIQFVQETCCTITEQILVTHIPSLKHLGRNVQWHMEHQYSSEMAQKTKVQNLSVIEANPSTTSGTIDICEYIQQYCPVGSDAKVHKIPCNVDQMSQERMSHSKRARATCDSEEKQLRSLVENAQEFHKSGIVMQDMVDKLFTQKSVSDVGTLYYMKELFNHRSVQAKVMQNYQQVEDFLFFVTTGFVLLLAMQLVSETKLDEIQIPVVNNGSEEAQTMWLRRLANRIVNVAFLPPSQEDVKTTAQHIIRLQKKGSKKDVFPYCISGRDTGEDLVQCCNSTCPISWLHLSCAGLDEPPADDWYCSMTCLNSEGYVYCYCKKKRQSRTISCAVGSDCKHHEKYHLKCLGVKSTDIGENWVCGPECTEPQPKDDDRVREYSLEVINQGLVVMANKYVVREGFGPGMLNLWRYNMPAFHRNNHYKYVVAAHNLLANVGGFESPRLQHELTWERVVNLKGGKGKNIAADLCCEMLNNDFKDMIRRGKGQLTSSQVQRVGIMSGEYGRLVDRQLRQSLGVEEKTSRSSSKKQNYLRDISKFCDMGDRRLFCYQPGRAHRGFLDFQRACEIKEPEKLAKKFTNLNKELDFLEKSARLNLGIH